MNSLASALAIAISHIENRSNVHQDDDVSALEAIIAELQDAGIQEHTALITALRAIGQDEMVTDLGLTERQ